jgi:hypothetical protein
VLNFRFHIPVDILEKSADSQSRRLISGICSTDDMDQDDERLLQEGLDFGPFLKSGWFNDNHASNTGGAVGVPTLAELRELPTGRQGWYVEGYLLDNPRADEIFELAKSLARVAPERKLGFSVEGQILARDPVDPKTVRKALVREVAVTRCPVNLSTELTLLAKSLSVGHTSPASPGTVATGLGGAAVLSREALESKKKKKKKKLKKEEAVALLMQKGGAQMTHAFATQIVEYAQRYYPSLGE